MRSRSKRLACTAIAAIVALSLTACGGGKEAATQVAAKVDSDEISVHQINQVLSRTNADNASPEAAQAVSRQVLEKLIDQQLAVTQAESNKLHRTPETMALLEAARREVLAQAWMRQVAAAVAKPTEEEARKFYAENPGLFSERRVYNLQEIVVPGKPGIGEQLRGFAAGEKAMEKAAAWLKEKNIKFGGGSATRPAEQVPMELLAKLQGLKDGQSVVIETEQATTMLHLVASQAAPVAEAAALPYVEQFLTNRRAAEAVAEEIKQLRAKAKISYMGEFTKAAP